jgi:hypothetical protein
LGTVINLKDFRRRQLTGEREAFADASAQVALSPAEMFQKLKTLLRAGLGREDGQFTLTLGESKGTFHVFRALSQIADETNRPIRLRIPLVLPDGKSAQTYTTTISPGMTKAEIGKMPKDLKQASDNACSDWLVTPAGRRHMLRLGSLSRA